MGCVVADRLKIAASLGLTQSQPQGHFDDRRYDVTANGERFVPFVDGEQEPKLDQIVVIPTSSTS